VLVDLFAPLLARGIIVRRPGVVGVLDRFDADGRAVRRLQRLRDAHGPGPVLLSLPRREVALVLAPGDVRRILEQSPEPFAPDNREKRAALGHFQPHGVLISHGAQRAQRRRFNERVLETDRPVHGLAGDLVLKVGEEARALLDDARRCEGLDWDVFAVGWWRLVRRVVLGEGARDDHELTDMLARLRADANWAFLKPRRARLRARFMRRLEGHIERAEPGSLASLVATVPAEANTDRTGQVPHWLFAFDALGIACFRTLALLAAHPAAARRAGEELVGRDLSVPQELGFLRACLLESLRLWPTTPAILRDTTADTVWSSGTLPSGAALSIYAPFFHRDGGRLALADTFAPEQWLKDPPAGDWPLIPFSAGPAKCPGRNLVLFLGSTLLALLLQGHTLSAPAEGALSTGAPLPATLSPFRLRFAPA
jgi:cytochrome P450